MESLKLRRLRCPNRWLRLRPVVVILACGAIYLCIHIHNSNSSVVTPPQYQYQQQEQQKQQQQQDQSQQQIHPHQPEHQQQDQSQQQIHTQQPEHQQHPQPQQQQLLQEQPQHPQPRQLQQQQLPQQQQHGVSSLAPRLPKCLIIGVEKGGTDALLEFLTLHPDIVVRHGDLNFFNDENKYRKGLEFYKTLLPPSLPEQIVVEKTPGYFWSERVPPKVLAMNSSMKMLLTVRDPVRRTLSAYAHYVRTGSRLPPVASLLFDMQGNVNPKSMYYLVQRSTYHSQLSMWLQYFPRDQIHIVDGEHYKKDPFAELYKVETFLEVGHKISKQDIYYDDRRGFYCMIKGNETECLPPSKGLTHPDLTDTELQKLNNYFEPLNKKFFEVANQTFDWT